MIMIMVNTMIMIMNIMIIMMIMMMIKMMVMVMVMIMMEENNTDYGDDHRCHGDDDNRQDSQGGEGGNQCNAVHRNFHWKRYQLD